jgi:hypothetical protein
MPIINLLLENPLDDLSEIENRVDNALIGVLAGEGPNLAPAGRRQVDSYILEVAWVDDQDSSNFVFLVQDSEIPATWLMVDIPDQSVQDTVLLNLQLELPILNYDNLLFQAYSWNRGALTRLALTHDPRLVKDLRELLARAFASPDVLQREDASMAAQLAGPKPFADLLRSAFDKETNSVIKVMLEQVLLSAQC